MRPKTPEEMTRARFWESCCAWMSPWILYPEEKESVEEITIDSTDKITDVAETRGSREEQLQQDHTCTSSKADACTQVTPTVRFEDEATIEACPRRHHQRHRQKLRSPRAPRIRKWVSEKTLQMNSEHSAVHTGGFRSCANQ